MGAGETAGIGETGAGGVEESTFVDVDDPSVGKAVVGETGVCETSVDEARPAGVGKTGAGETGAPSIENCAGVAESCVETVDDDDKEADSEDVAGEGTKDSNFSKTARGVAPA